MWELYTFCEEPWAGCRAAEVFFENFKKKFFLPKKYYYYAIVVFQDEEYYIHVVNEVFHNPDNLY